MPGLIRAVSHAALLTKLCSCLSSGETMYFVVPSQDSWLKCRQSAKLMYTPECTHCDGLQVLAGALKDNGRARIVGERTFGKGLIQTIVELTDGSGVAVTVARYQTPAGTDINKVGQHAASAASPVQLILHTQTRYILQRCPESAVTDLARPIDSDARVCLASMAISCHGRSRKSALGYHDTKYIYL